MGKSKDWNEQVHDAIRLIAAVDGATWDASWGAKKRDAWGDDAPTRTEVLLAMRVIQAEGG